MLKRSRIETTSSLVSNAVLSLISGINSENKTYNVGMVSDVLKNIISDAKLDVIGYGDCQIKPLRKNQASKGA